MTKKRVNPAKSNEAVGVSTKDAKATAEPITESSPPTPEERITAIEGEKAEIYDRMLRIAADFDNWKKRARRDQADGEMQAKESVLRDFLEIVDSLERATVSCGPMARKPMPSRSGMESSWCCASSAQSLSATTSSLWMPRVSRSTRGCTRRCRKCPVRP
jgi:molecular chaperone GrpE (heat shock protein)